MQWDNWQEAEFDKPATPTALDKQREGRLMQLAILLSLGLHGLLALLLLRDQAPPQPGSEAAPQFVRINLLPDNPLNALNLPPPAEVVPAPETTPLDAATPLDEDSPPQLAETPEEVEDAEDVEVVEVVEVDSPELAEPRTEEAAPVADNRVSEARPTDTSPVTPLINLSDVEVVQSTLQQMQDAERSQLWLRDCSRRQEENELLDCEPSRQADYSASRRNGTYSSIYTSTYESLQPVRSLSRSQRTLPTITANQAALAARLAEADINQGLADYLLQQTDAAISEGSNTSNRNVEQIIRMTDRSAAAQQAERVLGDAWIRVRSRELQQRRRVDQ